MFSQREAWLRLAVKVNEDRLARAEAKLREELRDATKKERQQLDAAESHRRWTESQRLKLEKRLHDEKLAESV